MQSLQAVSLLWSVGFEHRSPVVVLRLESLGEDSCQTAQYVGGSDDDKQHDEQVEREEVVHLVGEGCVLHQIDFQAQASHKFDCCARISVVIELLHRFRVAELVQIECDSQQGDERQQFQMLEHFHFSGDSQHSVVDYRAAYKLYAVFGEAEFPCFFVMYAQRSA